MKKLLLLLFFCAPVLVGYTQTTSGTNTLGSSNTTTSIQSTPVSAYRLSINGSIKQYGTGLNGVSSPSLFLRNTTSSTGRNYILNSSDAGLFQVIDTNAANVVRWAINNAGRVGIGTTSFPEQFVIGGGTTGNEILMGSKISTDGYNHIALNGSTNPNDYNFASKNTDKNLYINVPEGNFIYFGNGDQPKLSISPWGSISIQRNPWYSPPNYMIDVMAWNPNDGLNLETANAGFVRLFASHADAGKYNPITQAEDAGLFYGNKINDESDNTTNPTFGFVLAPWHNSASGLRMDANGNVGINNATPATPLDVNGIIKATGLIIPTGAGVNKILGSDANGNATWQSLSSLVTSGWSLTGNSGTTPATNFVGTTDSINLIFRTNNKQRASILADGSFNIASSDTSSRPAFRVYPNGDFAFNATNDYTFGKYENKSGVRYNSKLGILEIGASNNIDTTVPRMTGIYEKSGLIINSDTHNTIRTPRFMVSALIADNTLLDSTVNVSYSIISGESHTMRTGSVGKSIVYGYGQNITGGTYGALIGGQSNSCTKPVSNSIITGYANTTADSTGGSLVIGYYHSYGGVQQFVSGNQLINKTPMGTVLGNQNVDFTSLSYPGYTKSQSMTGITNLDKYPIFSIGNSRYAANSGSKSNAVTVLYNGRTQINTTGYTTNLTETDVTPKAALEIVSNNSGILLPKLTTTQRDAIVSGDLQNGLLLYNVTSSQFQFYDGSAWKPIGDGSSSASGAWSITGNAGSNPSTAFIGTTDNQPVLFKANNTEALRITADGNIGIGIATPGTYKLGVNGTIHAKKVRVDQEGWADYVFEDDYRLLTLTEVQKYITRYKHLPDVPSAGEVKNNGIDLGETQSLLLKKIEELTLYAIDQDKRIESKSSEIQTLNQQIEDQKKTTQQLQQQIDELKKLFKKN